MNAVRTHGIGKSHCDGIDHVALGFIARIIKHSHLKIIPLVFLQIGHSDLGIRLDRGSNTVLVGKSRRNTVIQPVEIEISRLGSRPFDKHAREANAVD